ncbi:TolC family protein [uncultured Arcticibacterium sp.]|uniref:TolC family protein n=1 Tax=uncultured Arcticibacterium sp. TaxID=2173042 RepID=UPI0030FB292E
MSKRLILVLFLSPVLSSFGQDMLFFETFLRAFEENHPAFKVSEANVNQYRASLLASKGVFDPVLSYKSDNKTLTGDEYYNTQNPELKVQTPYALRLKAGNEYASGKYLNPHETPGNLTYLGLELPILKGLLMDGQRAARKQAELMVSQSAEEQRVMLNNMYLDAIEAYWTWASSFQNYELLKEQGVNAQKRLKMTKLGFENGAKSRADTVEAFLQVQNINLLSQEAFIYLRKSTIALSVFLWDTDGNPYLLAESEKPQPMPQMLEAVALNEMVSLAKLNHPELKTYAFKLDGLAVERKLNRQSMLPTLDLKYNVLGKEYFNSEYAVNPYLANNYKFGLDFKIPLFLREGRGKFAKTNFKIQETTFLQAQKSWTIENKVRQYAVETNLLAEQLSTANQMADGYRFLLRNEELKFSQGESSLFLLISRENKLIDARQKIINVNLKYLKAYFKQRWAAGLLVTSN